MPGGSRKIGSNPKSEESKKLSILNTQVRKTKEWVYKKSKADLKKERKKEILRELKSRTIY